MQKKQQQRRNQQSQQFEKQQVDSQQKMAQRKSQDSSNYGLSEEKKTPSLQKREKPQTQGQNPRSLLEEVLQQYNLNDGSAQQKSDAKTSKEVKVKPEKSAEEKKHYTDYSDRAQPQKSRKKKVMESYTKNRKKGIKAGELGGDFFEKSSVEKNEIGIEGFNELLTFDQKSLVRGIVMAEVLGKPKSLQKKKAV